jgi:purine nucleosidase
MNEPLQRSVLLDTDIGSDVDDVLALGLILASPQAFSLVAVTTVCGDTQLRGQIAAGLLAQAGRPDVEVCPGESAPLLWGRDKFAWFGHEERCLPKERFDLCSEPAPERIVRAAREVEDLDLIMIGPMTNLARALALDPQLPRRVRSVTIMGGHIRQVAIGSHICPPGIDYNLCSDPEATMAVLGAGFRTRSSQQM